MDDSSNNKYQALQTGLGYVFKNQTLLERALTHSSTGADTNYERLEFLGDRVLGLTISDVLYHKFKEEAEGDLARRLASLAAGNFLAELSAEKLDLGAYIDFSDAERASGGAENVNILADVFEAVLGAIYLDSDFDTCKGVIEHIFGDAFYTMKDPPQHPKTALQEWAQGQGLPLPTYKITGQSGPDHAPLFDLSLQVKGYDEVKAQGRSRQQAEKNAAQSFLEQVSKAK